MIFVDDGFIIGALSPHLKACPICKAKGQRVIDVATFSSPERFGVEATILYDHKTDRQHTGIGLTCGCYARLFRQIGHINHSQLRSGKA